VRLRRWSFAKAARQRVRAEVSASASLRKERRLARKAARRRAGIRPWMTRVVFLGFLLPVAFAYSMVTMEYIVALILLWTLAALFLHAIRFRAALYDDPGLIVFDYWPIPDGEIFRAQWKKFLRRSWWTLFGFAAAYAILLAHSGGGWHALTGGLALGAVQWLFMVAMAVCLVAFARPKYFAFPAALFWMAAFLFLFAGQHHPRLCAWLSGLAWCLPPLGWILQSLGVSESSGVLHRVLPGLMSAVVLALSPIAFRRARQAFLLSEPRHATDGRNPELIEFGARLAQNPDDARAAIQRRQFLTGFDWQNAGFLERFVSRLLNARERVLAEFLLAANPRWTSFLRGVLPFFLSAVVVLWLFRSSLVPMAGMLVFMAVIFGAVHLFASPRGFALPPGGGLQSPYYALYPIGFWELTRLVLKINLAKTLVLLLFLLVLSAEFGGFQLLTVWEGLKLAALALMAQPLLVIAAISPNTNDTQKAGSGCLPTALMSVIMSVILGADATFFIAARWWIVAPAGLLAAAVPVFVLFLYGRWFNRSRFDLVPLQRTDTELMLTLASPPRHG